MNESTIENALKAVIENASAAIPSSISWPNLDHDGQPPYLEVIFTGGSGTNPALAGEAKADRTTGVMVVNVHTKKDIGTDDANGYATELAALFPKSSQISFSGGKINITDKPSIRKGFDGTSTWIVAVSIPYVATAT